MLSCLSKNLLISYVSLITAGASPVPSSPVPYILLAIQLITTRAAAPPPYPIDKLTNVTIPFTCGEAHARYQSAECCGADQGKPYIPVLSGECPKVISHVNLDWDTYALGKLIKNSSFATVPAFASFPETAIVMDLLRMPDSLGIGVYNWFNTHRRSRAGLTMLVDSWNITYTGGDPDGLKQEALEAFFQAAPFTPQPPHFEFPDTMIMRGVEVAPSCEAVQINMQGEQPSIEANFGFYAGLVNTVTIDIYVPTGHCVDFFSDIQLKLQTATGGKLTMNVYRTGGAHPAVC